MHDVFCPRPLEADEIKVLLAACEENRYANRNRVVLLLSTDAGLTVSEISALRRCHVMDDGLPVPQIVVTGKAARVVPMSDRLFFFTLEMLKGLAGDLNSPLILPERNQNGFRPMLPASVAYVLFKLYDRIGLTDASSRSGRRTFVKNALAALPVVGGTTADIQDLLGLRRRKSLLAYSKFEQDAARRRAIIAASTGKMAS